MTPVRRTFEDFAAGLRFRSTGAIVVTADRIKAFAAEFDPQPSHLDGETAQAAWFGELVASGWHTAAVAMRLIVESDLGLGGQGAGVAVEAMRWLRPVRPGDALRIEGTVTEVRPSRSRPDSGVVRFEVAVFNQHGERVLEGAHVILVRRRDDAGPAPSSGE